MLCNVYSILVKSIPIEHRWKYKLLRKWNDIIGSLEGKVHIQQMYDETILLSVSHPCWAQELVMMSTMLKKKINKVIGQETIKEIRFSYKSFVPNKSERRKSIITSELSDTQLSLLSSSLNPHELEALSSIHEPELQSIFKKFYTKCKKNHGSLQSTPSL